MTVHAILLGTAQDGGVPHAGCMCPRCVRALREPAARRQVACLGLVDATDGRYWLVDATPDLPAQWGQLASNSPNGRLAGILITHLHMGHYAGLAHLGREAACTRRLPVYAPGGAVAMLRENRPWSDLISGGHVELRELPVGAAGPIALSDRLSARAIRVPHRPDAGETVAFLFDGPVRRLFYCPDLDAWESWHLDLATFLVDERVDVALLDGTFLDPEELGVPMSEIPHPLAMETARRVTGLATDVRLIHLNHTNPLWEDGPEQRALRALGVTVGQRGDRWEL